MIKNSVHQAQTMNQIFISDNFWGAVVGAFAAIAVVYLTYQATKRLNVHAQKQDWNQTQANDFLECSRQYSQIASKIVVDIAIWADLISSKESHFKEKGMERDKAVAEHVYSLKLLNWDIKKYAESAHKTKKEFLAKEKELFDALSQLIGYCKNSKGDRFSLELIREKQNDFDKLAKSVHAELCGIKG
jgi:hypothetical protein